MQPSALNIGAMWTMGKHPGALSGTCRAQLVGLDMALLGE